MDKWWGKTKRVYCENGLAFYVDAKSLDALTASRNVPDRLPTDIAFKDWMILRSKQRKAKMTDTFLFDGKPGEPIIDLQLAANMVKENLPGWCWNVGTCCVSDDAWVAPDFNDPVHGPRLHAELDPVAFDGPFDSGFDVDRRPPGNVGQALLDAVGLALDALRRRAPR